MYEIAYRNNATGKTFKQDVLVMENLFYNRKISKVRLQRACAPLSDVVVRGTDQRSGIGRDKGAMADL